MQAEIPPTPQLPFTLRIVYEAPDFWVFDKPPGLMVHPNAWAKDNDNTVVSQLRHHFKLPVVYPAHRLDRATSGLLVVGKNKTVGTQLTQFFAEQRVEKEYLAIVRGWLTEPIRIDEPLRKRKGTEREVAQDARTEIEPLATAQVEIPVGPYPTARYSLVRARPQTGRYHQIRRHLNFISHPIVGDTKHGDRAHNKFFRDHFSEADMMLSAVRIRFPHPESATPLEFVAQPHEGFRRMLQNFGWELKLNV